MVNPGEIFLITRPNSIDYFAKIPPASIVPGYTIRVIFLLSISELVLINRKNTNFALAKWKGCR